MLICHSELLRIDLSSALQKVLKIKPRERALQKVLKIQPRTPSTNGLLQPAMWTLAQPSALVASAVRRCRNGVKAVMAALNAIADELRCPVWYKALLIGDLSVTSQHYATWAQPAATPNVESPKAQTAGRAGAKSPKPLLQSSPPALPQLTAPGPVAGAASAKAGSASRGRAGGGEPSSVAGSVSFGKGWLKRHASPPPPASPAASFRFFALDDAVSSVGDNPFDDLQCCEDLSSDVGCSQDDEVSPDLKSCKGGVSGNLASSASGDLSGDLKSCKDTLLPSAAESPGHEDLCSLFSSEFDGSPVKRIDPACLVDPFEGQMDLEEELFGDESSKDLNDEATSHSSGDDSSWEAEV
jgi:hypothetical protein